MQTYANYDVTFNSFTMIHTDLCDNINTSVGIKTQEEKNFVFSLG